MDTQTGTTENGHVIAERGADNDNQKEIMKKAVESLMPPVDDSLTINVTADSAGTVRVAFFQKTKPDVEVFNFTIVAGLLPMFTKRLLATSIAALQKAQAPVEAAPVSSPDINRA